MLKEKIQEKLESFGIPSKVYKRNNEIFVVENNSPRNRIMIDCPDELDISIKGSKKARQAVLHFTEPATTTTEMVHTGFFDSEKELEEFMANSKAVRNEAAENRIYSKGSRFTVKEVRKCSTSYSGKVNAEIEIEVKIPARENCLLVGFDEKSTFICQLPKTVSSVKEAYEVLRPKGISDNAIRIGEWFFDPVDDDKAKEILKHGTPEYDNEWFPLKNTYDKSCFQNPDFDPDSDYWSSDNHRADYIITYKNDVYVFGKVYDTTNRHEDVILTRLHRVVKNMELVTNSDKWD